MKKLVYAVTGANGQLGSFLVSYLRKNNHEVYELVRSKDKAQDKNFYRFFDLSEPDKMPSLKGVDILIHTAYFFDVSNPKIYQLINLDGSKALFANARVNNTYIIFISTISSYADANSLYGRTKFKIEQCLANDDIIIRPGLIFHNPLQGIMGAMDDFIKKYPVVPLISLGKQLLYPCLIENLATLIYKISLEQPTIKNPIVAASEQAITFKQLIKYLGQQRQKKVFLVPVPFFVVYFALKTLELFGYSIGLRSDSLLGLQYSNPDIDFYECRRFDVHFDGIST